MSQSQPALVAKRTADGTPDTTEITRLAEAAGYRVVDTVTQTRREDPATQLGQGKADALVNRAADRGVDAVVFDNALTPQQACALADRLPEGVSLLDRERLVLDIFAAQAGTRAASLQVELATLRYRLPRVRERIRRGLDGELAQHDEEGKEVEDLKRRIDTVRRKLSELSSRAADERGRRREEGFDLVAIAGYTNAGKSTLLHRLADDLDVAGAAPDHEDVDGVAEIADRLFETLETTTRRATVDGRRLLVTDTVGLVDDLPHDLVRSFESTLESARTADAVLLVADASDPLPEVRRKLGVSRSAVGDADGEVIPVLNKADRLDDEERAARRRAVHEEYGDPVAVSATEGDGVAALRRRLVDALPSRRRTVSVPNTGRAQRLLAWAHDHGRVADSRYVDRGETLRFTFEARPDVVSRLEGRVDDFEPAAGGHP